jgi:hypothetical protein
MHGSHSIFWHWQVLYRAYPRARDVLTACGGFQRFCSLFPADLEFLAQKGGGRDKVRLVTRKGRGGRRGAGSDGAASVLTQGGGTAPSGVGSITSIAANGGRAADRVGRSTAGRGAVSTVASVAESLVALLRTESVGSMPAAHASRRLCALMPGAEREIAAAGGFRRFCTMFPGVLGVDTDGGGRGIVFLRSHGSSDAMIGTGAPPSGVSTAGMSGHYWGEGPPLLPLPPPSAALSGAGAGGRGFFQPWQPASGSEAYEQHQGGWGFGDGQALWARPHPGISSWSATAAVAVGSGAIMMGGGGGCGSNSDGLQPRGPVTLVSGGYGRGGSSGSSSNGGSCGACGDRQAESRLVPCGHCVCRQCAHVMVMVMMVTSTNQR